MASTFFKHSDLRSTHSRNLNSSVSSSPSSGSSPQEPTDKGCQAWNYKGSYSCDSTASNYASHNLCRVCKSSEHPMLHCPKQKMPIPNQPIHRAVVAYILASNSPQPNAYGAKIPCSFATEHFSLQENNKPFQIKWKVLKKCKPYSNANKKCNLCLFEKCIIICKKELCSLNRRNELASSCPHRKGYVLQNFSVMQLRHNEFVT